MVSFRAWDWGRGLVFSLGIGIWDLGIWGFGDLGSRIRDLGLDQGWGRGRWGSDPSSTSPVLSCQDVSVDANVGSSWILVKGVS